MFLITLFFLLHINCVSNKLIKGTRQFLTIANFPQVQLIHLVQEGENIVGTHCLKSLPAAT